MADADVRRAVVERLDDTIFLEAGAGSGKTSCLVQRVVALVEDGVPVESIAAITFTERAAAELADRVRSALQGRAATSSRCALALEALDRAAIGTLHGFARRLLTEHPIEAGLPPRFEVLDEIGSSIAFQDRWESFVDRLLEDTTLERPFRLLLAAGARLDHLRDVAVQFDDNWDLVAERAGQPLREVPPVDVAELCDAIEAVVAEGDHCTDDDDRMLDKLDELSAYGDQLRGAPDDEARLELLRAEKPTFKGNGKRASWPDLAALKVRLTALDARRGALVGDVVQTCLEHLAEALAAFTVAAAGERRSAGELDFHDLLVLARSVLRDDRRGVEVRVALRERYRRLLLDEFQDTDPIQIELAVLLASDDPTAAQRPWTEVEVEPGRLFVVGDPKQSIYRFRRADIGVFLAARASLAEEPLQLTANFRTAAPVVEWVNRTFETLIEEEPGSQPAYVALEATRGTPPEGPPVALLGSRIHKDRPVADELRRREAEDVAGAVRRVVGDGWSVAEGQGESERWRPARWSDVAILLPARTSLRALERALEAANVPYRVETSSLVYATREVRDLLAVARAVEDPTDSLAVVAALRTPAFGCGDDDLYTWHVGHRGWWDPTRPAAAGAPEDHPVGRGLRYLGELHRQRGLVSPSRLLERIVRERRLLEVAFVHPRPRDLWRRLRFVLDQARAWEEAGGRDLRSYLAWVALQSAEGARVIETVLPETDDEAVRILTVHGAKGLEFPVTVLSGLTTRLVHSPRGVQVRFPSGGGWAISLKKGVSTAEYDLGVPLDEQLDRHERLRLLYVAATRARDHLLVSVHRKEQTGASAAELFWQHGRDEDLVELLDGAAGAHVPPGRPEDESLPALADQETWAAELKAAVSRGHRPLAHSASGIAEAAARAESDDPGLQKSPRDLDLPPWQKGRYGSAIGRAVHAVLQAVDLATGEGIPEAAAAQAAAEGVLGKERVIEALARSAIESPLVQEAARRLHWREVYVGTPLGETVLEGYLDLLFRDDEGLVVVDYKTDAWRTDAELDAKVERYRLQLAAYALAVEQTTGEKVTKAVLLFLSEQGAVERDVPGLDTAKAEVRAVSA